MATEAELEAALDAVLKAAEAPKRVEGQNTVVEAHPLGDRLEAIKAAEEKKAATRRMGGIRVTRMISPGPT